MQSLHLFCVFDHFLVDYETH